jgi:GT2 family glycosyltransferase
VYLQTNFPQIKLISNPTNLMWAGGNNVGLNYALENGYDWIMFANNDIIIEPAWASYSMQIAASDSRIGVIGFKVFDGFYPNSYESFRQAVSEFHILQFSEGGPVEGCFMLVKTVLFQELGLFDELYELYGEENDFEARARRAGVKVVVCNYPVWHHSMGGNRIVPLHSAYLAIRNELRLYLKHSNYGFIQSAKWLFSTMLLACDPRVPKSKYGPYFSRIHPSNNIITNFTLVVHAFIWNILHYSMTRRIAAREHHMCEQYKTKVFTSID